jgi:activator of HSP90 ATPase
MPRIHQEVTFDAPPARIYQAFMDSKEHSAFTGAPAQIEGKEGGTFSVYGGHVIGRNLELVPDRRIVQAWRSTDWPEGWYSMLRVELSASGGKTRLVLDHDAVPEEQHERVNGGWKMMYFDPLKKYLG